MKKRDRDEELDKEDDDEGEQKLIGVKSERLSLGLE
jgi:hypothetical protein